MRINGGYFAVTVSGISGGTVAASPAAAFPGTTVALTVTPDEGYALKAGSLKYRHGDSDSTPEGSGLAYTFTMPAEDVAVSAVFNPVLGGITIEGPRDETILVRAAHSAGGSSTTISRSANESVSFTLDSSGYTEEDENLLWFVEGERKTGTGNSLTIDAVYCVERTYNLTVMIKVNGQWYSAETVFTVEQ
jgi:hypothetical protein